MLYFSLTVYPSYVSTSIPAIIYKTHTRFLLKKLYWSKNFLELSKYNHERKVSPTDSATARLKRTELNSEVKSG